MYYPPFRKWLPILAALHTAALTAVGAEALRLGVFPAPPYNYLDEDGNPKGFCVDLLAEVARQEHWTVEYVDVTWAEGLRALQTGEIDILPSVAYTDKRAETMDFCYEPVLDSWGQIFAGADGAGWQIQDLEGRTVGITRLDINGVNFVHTADGLGISCVYREYDSHAAVFAAVQRGEADCGVAPQHYGLRNAAAFDLVPTGIQFSPVSSYFATKKGHHREVLSRLNSHLVHWKENNASYYFEAMNRWLGTGTAKRPAPGWLVGAVAGGAGLLIVLLYLIRFLRGQVRQRTEELRQREKKYRHLFENMTTGFALLEAVTWQDDDDGYFRFLEVNPAFEELVGMPADKLVGRFASDLLPELSQLWREDFTEVARTGAPRAALTELPSIDRVVEVWIFQPSEKQVAVVCADITARRRAQDQLKLLSLAVKQADETIVITNAAGNIEYANPAFETETGYTVAEILGKNPRLMKSGRHPPEFYTAMWDTLTAGKVWTGRIQNRRKSGEIFTEEASIAPIRDAAGTVTHYVAVKRDITNELALEAQYRQAQKMEAVGQLAGGVAHDFNNILQTIIGFTELLMHAPPGEAELHKDLMEIKQAARNGASLVRQLLTFSREQRDVYLPLNLSQVIEEESRMLSRLLGENVRFELDLADNLLAVQTDRVQMTQVIMNLCVNARDAMPEGGLLTISTRNRALTPAEAAALPEARAGRFVRLSVADSGPGIPPNIIDKLFDPFFTTKGPGKGTGLGLSVVYGIARQHNGWIELENAPGKGATFHIHFPASSESGEAGTTPDGEEGAPEPLASRGAGKRVLIIEDDPVIRELGRRIFENMGYRARGAGSASEARALFGETNGNLDLLVCDIGLPDANGLQLAKELVPTAPDLPVLFISGGERPQEDAELQNIRHDFIHKPFSVRAILTAIARLTHGPPD